MQQIREDEKRRRGEHLKRKERKSDIIKYILGKNGPVREPEIIKYLSELPEKSTSDQSTINKHLRKLKEDGFIELIEPKQSFKKGRRHGLTNVWGINKIDNIRKIIEEDSDLIGNLQNSKSALGIVLDVLIKAISISTKEEYAEIEEIKAVLESYREDLRKKLKQSATFFKLCVKDEYAVIRNSHDLVKLSDEDPYATFFVINGNSDDHFIIKENTFGFDVAFKACVALDIMERPADSRKDMVQAIEYVKQIKNKVSDDQVEQLKEYYKKTNIAPNFIRGKKFIPVKNTKLQEIEQEFEEKGGKFINYFNHQIDDLTLKSLNEKSD
jgi:DNA-binding transcriptional ArsR family regulator